MSVELSTEGPIGLITLNRPPANSYDHGFMKELRAAVDGVATDEDIRIVIVRSALDKFFSAGADVKAFNAGTVAENMNTVRLAHEALGRIAEIPKIFIAEIGAHALGGGLEIALACDLRFGADGDYRLGLPEATLGLLPGNGGTQRLPRLIGYSRALHMMITGETLTPEGALQAGILDRLFGEAALSKETLTFAEKLAEGAPKAIGSIKLAVHRGADKPLPDAFKIELEMIEQLFASDDAKEGLGAFLEKRKPNFKGS